MKENSNGIVGPTHLNCDAPILQTLINQRSYWGWTLRGKQVSQIYIKEKDQLCQHMLESLDVQSAVGITENEKAVTSFTAEAKGGYLL